MVLFFDSPPGGRVYLVTETQKWHLERPYQSKWADIKLSWSWRVYAEFIGNFEIGHQGAEFI